MSQASQYLQNINLLLNQLKTKYVSFSSFRTKLTTGHSIYTSAYRLQEVDTVRFLDLIINSNLNWGHYINQVCFQISSILLTKMVKLGRLEALKKNILPL